MSTLQELKSKITSLKNTEKITKAMQVVSATKLKRAGHKAELNRNYYESLLEIISDIVKSNPSALSKIGMSNSKENKPLIIIISTSRGLVGGLLSRLGNIFYDLLQQFKLEGSTPEIITVKPKSLKLAQKFAGKSDYHFDSNFETLKFSEIFSLKELILNKFLKGEVSSVYFVYTKFINGIEQTPVHEQILPIQINANGGVNNLFDIEPNLNQVADKIIEDYLIASIQNALINALSSEHAARMVAMNKAQDNSKKEIQSTSLQYNKSRQAKITSQIQEAVNVKFIEAI